jgi:hypothetical protein
MPIMNDRNCNFDLTDASGAWPFISRRVYQRTGHARAVWQSRHHRKALHRQAMISVLRAESRVLRQLFLPSRLNWWIGIGFATGAILFVFGAILSLAPGLAVAWSFDMRADNMTFVAGSIPFTIAAYLQLYQAANVAEFTPGGTPVSGPVAIFGWRPGDIGWLSCALQFPGTLLFNINTIDAMVPGIGWIQQDGYIWLPDFFGSLLFLASGYLAYAEIGHTHWSWHPSNLSWLATVANLFGCVSFLISALFAFVPPWPQSADAGWIATAFTLLGAVGFLLGSLMMVLEAAVQELPETKPCPDGKRH